MTPRKLLDRFNNWTVQHPWLTMLVIAAIGIPILWLLPPYENPALTVAKLGLFLALGFALNLLRYRTIFPSPQQIAADERKADEIAAAVRRQRELDSRL